MPLQSRQGYRLLLIVLSTLYLCQNVLGFALVKRNSKRGSSCCCSTSLSAAASASKMASQTSVSLPNWRTPCLEDDTCSEILLQKRDLWSLSQQQDALQLYQDLMSCTDSYVAGPIKAALNHLDHAYRLYGPESVICSFNGGKDAVVILHLVRAAHAHHCASSEQDSVVRPRVIYFDHEDEFPEVQSFLQQSVQDYDLDMIAFEKGVKFPQGLKLLVDNNRPSSSCEQTFPLAFVLGTRTSDPNADQQGHFAPSSHYMPPFMRVNPILEWTYGHVWHFLRLFKLPYCSLYDQGYTSLGTTKDTLPCPALAVAGCSKNSSLPKYWPAYMLRDWDQERSGRISKDNKPKHKPKPKIATTTTDDNESSLSRADDSSIGHLSTMSEVRTKNNINNESLERFETDAAVDDSASCVSFSGSSDRQKTVGVLIIGDEILKGFTADTNTQTAARALREQNVLLKRVVVVSDNLEEIKQEIGRMQREVDVIITSGGVGPTHDDVTIKSVAAALGCEMEMHDEMAQLLREKMNKGNMTADLTEAQMKMATLPSSSKLRYLSDNPKDWPVLQCRNIFVLPGIPEFFAAKIENVAKYLSCQLERGQAFKVVLSVDENSIVPVLNQVVANHPDVSIGSYPFVSHPEYKTVITVEGRLQTGGRSNSVIFDKEMIEQPKRLMDQSVQLALDELINTLPKGSVLRVDNDNMLLYS